MHKKRVLSTLLSAAMVASLLPTTAFAAGSYTAGTYSGSAVVYCDEDEDFDDYSITVGVTVDEAGTIGAIEITGYGDAYDSSNSKYVSNALNGKKNSGGVSAQLVGQNIESVLAMSEVDTVSGATCTSNALLEAVKAAAASVPVAASIDTSTLSAAVAAAEMMEEGNYTEESWSAFSQALSEAQDVLAAPESQEAVDTATGNLTDAQAALVEKEAEKKATASVSAGGVTYYYADTSGDAVNTIYTVSITTGRGPSATTTVYEFTKADLTQVGESDVYYIVAPGSIALSGTLYGYSDGTASTYKSVYGQLGASTEDPAYDAVSSATNYSGYHAKDISSVVTFGNDADGNKVINGLNLYRGQITVDAAAYVDASILKAAGYELTEEQTTVLAVKLKANPMVAPAEGTISVALSSASWTSSRYGDGEFAIVPDDSVEGYVWSEYWDNLYAATISNGTTTVGAVHWIDLYGEAATSGPHYNKVEIALNNGTSVASNGAEVSRYAAFYDVNTGNIKAGTYIITLYSEGYTPLTAEVTIASEAMKAVSVGGMNYYYADTNGDDANTIYTVSVTSGRGPSAVTTVYNYLKSDLTQIDDSGICYIAAPGVSPLEGTLYGYSGGDTSNYRTVYEELGASTEDPAYDAVSSATNYSGYHAKDISSVVTFGNDADGYKVINGLNLNRASATVDSDIYVNASILKAAGVDLTEEQAAALAVTLKLNPTIAPLEDIVEVSLSSASWTTSRYGIGEFAIVPDDSVEGYVWSEYWDNLYAATISNGTTTVGAVHWIDLYGEAATSGPHYNKVELALNNGTSVASNEAEVNRYAAFFNKRGEMRPGTYTITLYSEGYTPLTAQVVIEGSEELQITEQPVNWNLSDGKEVTYSITAENAASFRWYFSKDGGKHWYPSTLTATEDGETSSISLKAARSNLGTSYCCVVTGLDGTKVKSEMVGILGAPAIEDQPSAVAYKAGKTAVFSVKAAESCKENAEYQWYYSKDGGTKWFKSTASGAATESISVKMSSTNKDVIYRCKVSVSGIYVYSDTVGFDA